MEIIPIFVNYDNQNPSVYHTCVDRIIQNSTIPVSIIPLNLSLLGNLNISDYSLRFLIPYICNFNGHAIYIHNNIKISIDIIDLWMLKDHCLDVQLVKSFNVDQVKYPNKYQSNVILWNCRNFPNRILTPENIMNLSKDYLENFKWLKAERIGELLLDRDCIIDE